MSETKKFWQSILWVLLLLAAVVLLFRWYSTANSQRIETQNLNYTIDSARQTAKRIEGEFANAVLRIRNYAYLLDTSLSEPDVGLELLRGIEENSIFDAIHFTNKEGIDLASSGVTSNNRDKTYFIKGMQGASGLEVVFTPGAADEAVITFYAPLRHDGEVFGMLLGMYYAENYLQNMLAATYFGEAAGVYLCTQEGRVIACSGGSGAAHDSRPLLDRLREENLIDPDAAAEAWNIFHQGDGEGGVICDSKSATDNLCVLHIPNSDYVLVQTFPRSVTRAMIENANHTGIVLQCILIGLFALYILVLVIRSQRKRKLLERENREMGYVIDGVTSLFSCFVLVDLLEGSYCYLAGTKPEESAFATAGRYKELSAYFGSLLADENDRSKFLEQMEPEALAAGLGSGGANIQYEYRIRRANVVGWEHMNILCLEQKEGRASKALMFWQDVTKLKEEQLRTQAEISIANRKERQYRIAITSNAFCTFEFNLTKDLMEEDIARTINGRRVSLLEKVGLKAPCKASDCFERWKAFVLEESMDDYAAVVNLERLREGFEAGEAEATVDYWEWASDTEQMCVRQSFIMTRDSGTGDIMVMVVSKDITEQVQKQREQTQALHEALMQAQHANNAKTTFLSNMSHDIRTPMNAIIGFTTIAVTHIDNQERVRDSLQKVLSSSNHLLSLINDILDMSRIESGKVQIKEQECNISELTHNLVSIIQPQVKAKQMELFIDTFDVANEDVIADSLKLSQVFVNLLSNAVKYTPAGGTVSFRITQETTFHRGYGDYTFVVKDNGIGMSPEFVEHIFEPFEREASTTKTGIQGTGLGMAITKNIVDMMGGVIEVQSEKGKGSEFRVRLSLKLQDKEKNAAQIKELEGLRAMVVDDDPDSCDSVTRMLKQLGMRAEWTTSGREAVYRAKSAHNEGDCYHTYIIDWQMPEMSGVETARGIRAAVGPEAPIIVLTAYDWADIEEEARKAGVNAFCAKPLFLSDLKNALRVTHNLAQKESEAASWSQADFSGKRILLVEDNELNREIAQAILEETGFMVETAPDGTDAVSMMQQAAENYYDAILMDVQMPVMDGYEATRTIRALPRKEAKSIPIIAMTANAMEEDK
ncbi:MAG: response regulator, partial [Clostridiales bacterium]|nr:response regulator [Clostridiales bacterium]